MKKREKISVAQRRRSAFDLRIEGKWQEVWEREGVYRPDLDKAKRPFYNLMMFPYPSAEGLHIGNTYAFTGADMYGRFKRMQGFDVFEPIGLDGFGIHSENYAITVGRHPRQQAKISEKNFYRQLRATGNGYDWSRTVETYDPDYYKWTQWIFIQLFKAGLAYRQRAPVNFCPSCKTVLADEQVIEGRCERCKSVVEKRELEQWFFRITTYADRLLDGLDKIDWTEKVKIAQRQWIGRSEGALIEFKIQNAKFKIEVFTTALDTVYGVTFIVLSPQHPLLSRIGFKRPRLAPQGEALKKEKTGVDTGYKAINPFTGEEVSVWVADYVLMEYGTGAVMGVPGHDARDHEFAAQYKLPIKPVIRPTEDVKNKATVGPDGFWDYPEIKSQFADKSILFESGEFSGLTSKEAKEKMSQFIEKKDIGKRTVNYHLRDWLISRQRYWGPPIPMVYCQTCADAGRSWFTVSQGESHHGEISNLKSQISNKKKSIGNWKLEIGNSAHEMRGWFPVPEEQLPVLLPDVKDWKPKGIRSTSSGQAVKSPLASVESFVKTSCPNCGGRAMRETDVSDTFLDSSWYFLRYLFTEYKNIPFGSKGLTLSQGETLIRLVERVKRWLPVSMYIGGAEHSVLHLLYTRFLTMVFHDLKLIDFEEPFPRFFAHGLLIKEGAKMSKSRGNVVVPDAYIKRYGADTLRTYLMFLGPFSQGGDFYDSSIAGIHRFLNRAYILIIQHLKQAKSLTANENLASNSNPDLSASRRIKKKLHQTIRKVTDDLEHFRFNTAIAALMELLNIYYQYKTDIKYKYLEQFLLMLAPFSPHLAEELYQMLTRKNAFKSIHKQQWPVYDPKLLEEGEVTIVVQVNGKVRDTVRSQKSEVRSQKLIEEKARTGEKIKKYLEGRKVKKVIYVEGKILNFVTG